MNSRKFFSEIVAALEDGEQLLRDIQYRLSGRERSRAESLLRKFHELGEEARRADSDNGEDYLPMEPGPADRDGYTKVDQEKEGDGDYAYADPDRKITLNLKRQEGAKDGDYVGRQVEAATGDDDVGGEEEYDDVEAPAPPAAAKDGGYVEFQPDDGGKKGDKKDKKNKKEKKEKKKGKDREKDSGYVEFSQASPKEKRKKKEKEDKKKVKPAPLMSIELAEEDEEEDEDVNSPTVPTAEAKSRPRGLTSAFRKMKEKVGSLRRDRSPSHQEDSPMSPASLPQRGVNQFALMQEVKVGAYLTGFLSLKKKKDLMGGKWEKRFYVLKGHTLYYAKKESESTVKVEAILLGYEVNFQNKGDGCQFDVSHSGTQKISFKAEDPSEASKWVKVLKNATRLEDDLELDEEDEDTLYENPSDQEDDSESIRMKKMSLARSLPPEPDEELYEDVDETEEVLSPVPAPTHINLKARGLFKAAPPALPVTPPPTPPLPSRAPKNPPAEPSDDDGQLYDDVEEPVVIKKKVSTTKPVDSTPKQAIYKVICPHIKRDAKEITIQRGDLVLIDDTSDDLWWTGTLQNKEDGTFTGPRGFIMKTWIKALPK
eukprot:m.7830 g.7830  ORF g.7830 m.7830 type:complete len:598 (+) comp19760_c0_seq1:153-1946(+)